MKLILEYAEVVRMIAQQLNQDIDPVDIKVNTEPFSLEIWGLDLDQIIKIQETRRSAAKVPAFSSSVEPEPESDAEKPMTTVDNAKDIADMLGKNEELAHSDGGAGPVPTEIPEDFLPVGASYDAPGETEPEEIGRRR